MPPRRPGPSLLVGATTSALLLLTSTVRPYGLFIDELYFIACSRRLDWGFVDQPPLSLALLALERAVLGEGQVALRVLPALAIGATAWLAGRTARMLGASPLAEGLASLAVATMPVLLVFGSFYSMNAYEPLLVTAAFLLALRLVREEDPRLWVPIGLLMGIGLEMKHTMVLYGAALGLGFLATGARRLLLTRWTLWGALACLALLLPNLLWQHAHGYPSLELYRNSFGSKNIDRSWIEILAEQAFYAGPATLPLWAGGLAWLATGAGRPYRFLGVAYAALLAVMIAGHSSRPDRIASIYPVLAALGAVALGGLAARRWRAVPGIYAGVLLAAGLALAPIFAPVLPPALLGRYVAALGLRLDIEASKRGEPVPQWLADRLGWRELAEEVARVHRSLPEDERASSAIVSASYGAAGALELYGPALGLPRVYATQNSYHSWGPPPEGIRTLIGVQVDGGAARRHFRSVEEAAVHRCPECTRPQRQIPIYLLREPRSSIEAAWPGWKNYH